jgi:hypothetical protein
MAENKEEKCSMCGTSENDSVLLQAKKDGEFFWVCVRCLPVLIHG